MGYFGILVRPLAWRSAEPWGLLADGSVTETGLLMAFALSTLAAMYRARNLCSPHLPERSEQSCRASAVSVFFHEDAFSGPLLHPPCYQPACRSCCRFEFEAQFLQRGSARNLSECGARGEPRPRQSSQRQRRRRSQYQLPHPWAVLWRTFRHVGSFGWQQPVMTAPTSVALKVFTIVHRGEALIRREPAEQLQRATESTKLRISIIGATFLILRGRFTGITVRTAMPTRPGRPGPLSSETRQVERQPARFASVSRYQTGAVLQA